MVTRSHEHLKGIELEKWWEAYNSALQGLVHRKTRPTMLRRFCEEHAWNGLDAYRAARGAHT